MSLTITRLTNADREFYPVMGPFLANRDVVKFVGDKIWDDPGKTWFVAREGSDVVGFVAVTELKKRTLAESLYLADADRTDAAAALVAQAVREFGHDRHLEVTVKRENAPAYTGNGFAEIGPVGKHFLKLARAATVTRGTR
ncbi:hypothetical protein ABZ234_08700 [Nocardiopsis sp. NPDC006198]|uniref:hypothetical protein n=1 Tax=Nocardiopsis sp. NPDC006198 TaxID=3154472 RepID=UPI0033A1CBF7